MSQRDPKQALEQISEIAFEIIKNSPKKERKISVEDQGDHCVIHFTMRVIKAAYSHYEVLVTNHKL